MADDWLGYQNPGTIDERLDTESLIVAAVNVHRERVQIAGSTDVAIAAVVNAAPTTQYGVVVRNIPSGTQTVAGTVTATGPLTDAELRATPVPVSGTVTANLAAGTNNIGDVDVLSVPAPLNVSGGGTEAAALRVTVANDSTGVLSVDDNGASLTVDGTVTANAGANLNTSALALEAGGNLAGAATSLAVVDDWDEADRAKVNPIAGQAGIQGGAGASTALTTRIAIATDANTVDTELPTSSTLSDGTPNPSLPGIASYMMSFDGSGWNRVQPAKPAPVYELPPQKWSYHENSSSALTDATVQAAPGAGLSLYVTDIICSTGAATAMNVFFEEGAVTVLGPYYLEAVAGRGVALQFKTPKKITANTALTVTTSAAISHSVDVLGFIAPA